MWRLYRNITNSPVDFLMYALFYPPSLRVWFINWMLKRKLPSGLILITAEYQVINSTNYDFSPHPFSSLKDARRIDTDMNRRIGI